jgi:choline dehydrogenase-like flavoprotein
VCVQQSNTIRFFATYRAELEAAKNLWVLLNTNLVRIQAEDAGGIDRVTRVDGCTIHPGTTTPNVRFTVTAARYVLALGGIETVRALLNSPSASQPRGLGNNGDLVGRYFNVHPVAAQAAQGTFEPGTGWTQAVRDCFGLIKYPRPSGECIVRGLEVPDYEAQADGAQPDAAATEPPVVFVWSVLEPSGEALREGECGNFRVMLGGDDHGCDLNVCWEQLPSRDSRLTLADSRDVFGNRQVRVEWKLSRQDEETYNAAVAATRKRLEDAGYVLSRWEKLFHIEDRASWARRDRNGRPNLVPGDHPMGGTRMSLEPRDGVVNPDCRLHAVSNLYVSSSSNWPSGGWANPMLTIVAMALRLAVHLVDRAAADVAVHVDQAEIAAPAAAPEA